MPVSNMLAAHIQDMNQISSVQQYVLVNFLIDTLQTVVKEAQFWFLSTCTRLKV